MPYPRAQIPLHLLPRRYPHLTRHLPQMTHEPCPLGRVAGCDATSGEYPEYEDVLLGERVGEEEAEGGDELVEEVVDC